MANGYFKLMKSDAKQPFRFTLHAPNHKVILRSEKNYATKRGASNGIESVKKNSGSDARYVRKTLSDKQHFFNLTATNGQVVGTSELYGTVQGLENGIQSVMRNGSSADTKDET